VCMVTITTTTAEKERERERERERVMIFYDFRQRSPKVAFFLAKRGAHTSGAS
jgi:precorrin-6B methylase 1